MQYPNIPYLTIQLGCTVLVLVAGLFAVAELLFKFKWVKPTDSPKSFKQAVFPGASNSYLLILNWLR
jgi:hypothetical protein